MTAALAKTPVIQSQPSTVDRTTGPGLPEKIPLQAGMRRIAGGRAAKADFQSVRGASKEKSIIQPSIEKPAFDQREDSLEAVLPADFLPFFHLPVVERNRDLDDPVASLADLGGHLGTKLESSAIERQAF
jgi:hypothetical protein